MKNIFRKLWILCVFMTTLFAVSVHANAAGVSSMSAAQQITSFPYHETITLTSKTGLYWKIVPNVTSSFTFTTTGSKDNVGYLLNAAGTQLASDDDGGSDENFKLTYTLSANTTYYLRVGMYSDTTSGTFDLTVTSAVAQTFPFSPVTSVSTLPYSLTFTISNETKYWDFTPTASGTYIFATVGPGDSVGTLYSTNGSQLATDDDSGSGDNFQISQELTAGTRYVLGVKNYGSETDSYTYTLTVKTSSMTNQGSCGANLIWEFDGNGTLTIKGVGAMQNYHERYTVGSGRYSYISYTNSPWYSMDVRRVVVQQGVTSIGDYAFYNCRAVSFSLPSSLTKIGVHAFSDTTCARIEIPAYVESIGNWAFSYSSIASVRIPDSVTQISESAFYHCSALKEVTIPVSVTSIGSNAFAYCNAVERVDYLNDCACKWGAISFADSASNPMAASGKALLYLGGYEMRQANMHSTGSNPGHVYYADISDYAFYNCKNSFMPVSNGGYNGKIGKYAFYNCTNMTGTSLASALREIGEYAFYNCSNASYWYYGIFEGPRTIGAHAFDGCKKLTGLTYCRNWTVGDYAFANTGIERLTIEEGVTEIPVRAFDSAALKEIVFPQSLTTIGAYAFCNNGSLNQIRFKGRGPVINSGAFYSVSADVTYYPGGSWSNKLLSYGGSLTWKPFGGNCGDPRWTLSEDGVLTISGSGEVSKVSFVDSIHPVKSIVIQEGITSLPDNAFSGCSKAETIHLPKTLLAIGNDAFAGCAALTTVKISDLTAWANIQRGTGFSYPNRNPDCQVLLNGQPITQITLTDAAARIGAHAFENFSQIEQIIIPESVKAIDDYAFSGCTGAAITLPDAVWAIAHTAFGDSDDSFPQAVYCHAGTQTSRFVGMTDEKNFIDPDYPDYVLYDNTSMVTAVNYTGNTAEVVVPEMLDSWSYSETINDLILPQNLSGENRSYNLHAKRVTVPDGVSGIHSLVLHEVDLIYLPDTLVVLDNLTLADCSPTVYCWMDSEAELWALINGYNIAYLDEVSWNPVLSYNGPAISLDVGEAYVIEYADFSINPLPQNYTGSLTLESSEGLSVEEYRIIASDPGDWTVIARMDDTEVQIPVHVFQPVYSFQVAVPVTVEKGTSFAAEIKELDPTEGSRMLFTWEQDGEVLFEDASLTHSFTAPMDAPLTDITVTASSGAVAGSVALIPQKLEYKRQSLFLEIGETITFAGSDFALTPGSDFVLTPEQENEMAGILDTEEMILNAQGMRVNGNALTTETAGDYVVSVSLYGCTTEIPVHVYQAVSDFTLTAPAIVVSGNEFAVSLTDISPADISGIFSWYLNGERIYIGTEQQQTISAPAGPAKLDFTVAASDGLIRAVSVLVAGNISEPVIVNRTVEQGDAIRISVSIDGTEYVNDANTYQQIILPASAAGILYLENGQVIADKPGRAAIQIKTLTGEVKSFAITVQHTIHTEVKDEGRKPTCTEPGLTDGVHCSVCGTILTNQEVIPASGHTAVIDKAVPATCKEPGLTDGSHCSDCGAVLKEQTVVAVTNHKRITVDAVAPTYTQTGLRAGTVCEYCGEVFEGREIIPVIPEKWDMILPASTSRIEDEAFLDLPALYSARLSETCTFIGAKSFAGCNNLMFVYIPNGNCVIDETAFGDNTNIIIVTVPDSAVAAQVGKLGLICASNAE